MEASLVVSIFAVAVAAGSLALALRADRRAGRAEARSLRAQLVVEPRSATGDRAGRRFELLVRNVGSDVARRIEVWLEDEAGRPVSARAGGDLTLAAGGDSAALMLIVAEAALPPPPVSFSVWIAWSDAAGRHDREHAGVTVST